MLRRGEITDSMSVIALLHEAVRRLEARRLGEQGSKGSRQMEIRSERTSNERVTERHNR